MRANELYFRVKLTPAPTAIERMAMVVQPVYVPPDFVMGGTSCCFGPQQGNSLRVALGMEVILPLGYICGLLSHPNAKGLKLEVCGPATHEEHVKQVEHGNAAFCSANH